MEIPTPDEFTKAGGYKPFPPRWNRFLSALREGILSAQPQAGRHVSIDEHPGKGTVINVDDTSGRRKGGGGPPPPTGACCHPDGTCTVTTSSACASAGGTYQGNGTVCSPNPCPPPTGACCHNGSCLILSASACAASGGTYQGDHTTCAGVDCGHATSGACCVGTTCSITHPPDCTGTYQGDNTTCSPNPCTSPPSQIMCCTFSNSSTCAIVTPPDTCSAHGWTVALDPNNLSDCRQCSGACCADFHSGGFHEQCCTILAINNSADCPSIGTGYVYLGDGTNCADNCWTFAGQPGCGFSGDCLICS